MIIWQCEDLPEMRPMFQSPFSHTKKPVDLGVKTLLYYYWQILEPNHRANF